MQMRFIIMNFFKKVETTKNSELGQICKHSFDNSSISFILLVNINLKINIVIAIP